MKDPEFAGSIDTETATTGKEIKPQAKIAVLIFGIAIIMVLLGGAFPQLVPNMAEGTENFSVSADGSLKMVTIIEIVTLSAAGLIMLITKTSPAQIVKASLFNSMASAMISVFGVVWMSSTFMAHNEEAIKQALGWNYDELSMDFCNRRFYYGHAHVQSKRNSQGNDAARAFSWITRRDFSGCVSGYEQCFCFARLSHFVSRNKCRQDRLN
jgi:anaerobic C4-dicarboxylate transporter DcuA